MTAQAKMLILVGEREAAAALGLTPRTLQAWRHKGEGPIYCRLSSRCTMEKRLSVPDAFSLALAKETGAILLTGDQPLRTLAENEHVECHGLLWFFDVLEAEGVLKPDELHKALTRIRQHPRCRLPADEVDLRLARYARGL